MKSVDKIKLAARHAAMLECQRKIAPFTPTIRELTELWELRSTSNAARILEMLERDGRAISREHGETKSHYAVDPQAQSDMAHKIDRMAAELFVP